MLKLTLTMLLIATCFCVNDDDMAFNVSVEKAFSFVNNKTETNLLSGVPSDSPIL